MEHGKAMLKLPAANLPGTDPHIRSALWLERWIGNEFWLLEPACAETKVILSGKGPPRARQYGHPPGFPAGAAGSAGTTTPLQGIPASRLRWRPHGLPVKIVFPAGPTDQDVPLSGCQPDQPDVPTE